MGETDVEAQRLPKGNKTSKCHFSSCKIYWCNSLRQCRSTVCVYLWSTGLLVQLNTRKNEVSSTGKMGFNNQNSCWNALVSSLLGSQGGYTTGKGRIHPWMSCQFILLTVFLQLSKAVITHTCWLVLQVLQVVLVGRAGLTHHLSKTFYSSQGKRTSINGGMVEPMLWEGLRPCHRRGSDASSRWGWTRRYRSCTWWPSGLGSR